MKPTIKKIATLFMTLYATCTFCQDNWNFGLNVHQRELPKSNAPFIKPTLKPRVDQKTALRLEHDNQYVITNGWDMIEAYRTVSKPILEPGYNTSHWYNATVPGTVLTTLVNQGVYADPYFGLNNLSIPDSLCRMDWWYRVEFDMPKDINDPKHAQLLFNGINYKAQIWFNGKLLGNIAGAFQRGMFDVGDIIRPKGNVLAVQILPPANPGIPHEATIAELGPNGGILCLDGPTFIASEGWDWMPGIRDRNIGIWQDVRLCFNGAVTIQDPQIITSLNLPDTTVAQITIKSTICNKSDEARTVILSGDIDKIHFKQSVSLAARQSKCIVFTPEQFSQLNMPNPRLWWPNGYGAQGMYDLHLRVSDQSKPIDSKTIRFGIRELSYELMVDTPDSVGARICYSPTDVKATTPLFSFNQQTMRKWDVNPDVVIPKLRDGVDIAKFEYLPPQDNPFLMIKVNGVPIFCKGGNWGMDDAMKRVSREQLEPYIKLHAKENFNIIRNWLGQSTEEVFYELCDKYGLLVWNDFTISTAGYSLRPSNYELLLANASDIVKRFVNHPSIAIWCSGNETYAPQWLEEEFQKLTTLGDGTRHYMGNSRYVNMTSSGPWCYIQDHKEYYNRLAMGFNSELGAPSVPTYETMKKFIPEQDMWPRGDVWSYHDAIVNGWVGWNEYCQDIDSLGVAPCKDAEEFCRRAQIINYNAHRVMFEAWNSKLWENTSGVIYWMSHPAWYSVIQQTYSWDYKTFGTYFGCMESCEPLHIQWNLTNGNVQVVNTTNSSYSGARVSYELYGTEGKLLNSHREQVDIPKLRRVNVFNKELPRTAQELVLARLTLRDSSGRILSQNDYWCNDAYSNAPKGINELAKTTLKLKVIGLNKNTIAVEVKNTGRTIAPYVEMNALFSDTNASILPAYISESYFNLLPQQSKVVRIELPEKLAGNRAKTVVAIALNGDGSVEAN